MKNLLILVFVLPFSLSSVFAQEAPNSAQAKKVMMSYGKALKGQMGKAMKAGGPLNAISFCNVQASQITQHANTTSGWSVSRTSLKLRKASNKPDAWEEKVLKAFEQRKANGESVKKMAFSEVVKHDGKKVFRFMKAIPTAKVCTACHGGNLNSKVEAKLDALYPNDKARGFKVGDIRGAFSLSKSF